MSREPFGVPFPLSLLPRLFSLHFLCCLCLRFNFVLKVLLVFCGLLNWLCWSLFLCSFKQFFGGYNLLLGVFGGPVWALFCEDLSRWVLCLYCGCLFVLMGKVYVDVVALSVSFVRVLFLIYGLLKKGENVCFCARIGVFGGRTVYLGAWSLV